MTANWARRWVHTWARERHGVTEIRISYGGGSFYNGRPCRFGDGPTERGQVTLAERNGALVLDLPWATEAVVPQRPYPAWPGRMTWAGAFALVPWPT